MSEPTFPFQRYRQGQREVIDRARDSFASGKRFVIVEAPTGSGKSAIAVTLTREAESAYVLTAQKVLQDQYVRTFPELALMKGRGNYPCLIAPTHAAAAPCIAGRRLPECDACPYFCAKDGAIAADSTIMNYAYYLAELNYSGGFGPRDLLVLDEAHNAEAALMSFIQIDLSDVALARVGIGESLPVAFDDEDYFDFAEEVLPLIKRRSRELDAELRDANFGSKMSLASMQSKHWLDNQWKRLELLRDSREENFVEWVVERRRSSEGETISFKPVEVAAFAEPLLFGFADRILMLSATILDAPTFLRSLGIEREQVEVIRIGSGFPAENRPVFLKPTARLTRHYLEQALPKIVDQLNLLFTSHSTEKGLIHAHSYKIAGYIARNLSPQHRKRLVTHFTSEGRDVALEKHLNSREPTVLLTPSMTEGIDLTDELSRWQVICKIPYPYLGDPQVARRKEIDAAWYDWRTCLTVVQAYGRSVRSEDDFAVTYLLDADFPRFLKRQRSRLPPWFLEAIHL
ncbi:MAG: ATP-dependent DNA helicase [Trueperaceae bacterium]|nr:MAG: ATP-dependent DNA helicase [Trueperaceae bacterium]